MGLLSRCLVICALASPGAALAQPYSTSLAQCAALYEKVARGMSQPKHVDAALAASETLFEAAVDRARQEGRAKPILAAGADMDAQRALWRDVGATWVFSEDFRDWTAYCRKFAKAQGLDILPEGF